MLFALPFINVCRTFSLMRCSRAVRFRILTFLAACSDRVCSVLRVAGDFAFPVAVITLMVLLITAAALRC